MTTELVQYGQFDVQTWAQERPDANPVDEYIAGLKLPSSRVTMLQALGAMAGIFDGEGRPDIDRTLAPAARKKAADELKEYARNYDWFAIDDEATIRMLADLKSLGYAKSSQSKMLAAVTGVLQRCMRIIRRHDRKTRQQLVSQWRGTTQELAEVMKMMDGIVGMRFSATQSALDELSDFEPQEAPRDVDAPAKKEGRALKPDEVKALFNACAKQGGAKGARDMAILALGIGCGLRRSEIAKLRYEDVTWKGEVMGDDTYLPIEILGAKGDQNRLVNAANGTRQSLLQWRAIRGTAKGPLLYSFDRWTGMQTGLPIDGQTVYAVLADLAAIANKSRSEDEQITLAPHDLRRTFVTDFIRTTRDISMASKLAGHKSIETTKGYDKSGEEDKARAVIEAVHVPFELITVQTVLE